MNPTPFTFELLNGLKFKELQKLSIKFNVNKRWAKKQELIENLLSLKACDEKLNEDDWKNGSLVFSDEKKNFSNEHFIYQSTNIINNQNGNVIDRRLTFTISQKVNDSTIENQQSDPKKKLNHNFPSGLSKTSDSKAAFEISPKLTKLIKCNFDESVKENTTENDTFLHKNCFEPLTNKSDTLKIEDTKLVLTSALTDKRDGKEEKLNEVTSTTNFSSLKSSFLKKNALENKNMLNQHSIKLTKYDKESVSKIPKKCHLDNGKMAQESHTSHKKNMFKSAFENKNLIGKKCEDQIGILCTPAYQKCKTKAFVPQQKTSLNKASFGIKRDSQTSNLTHQSKQNHLTAKKMPDFKKIHEKQFKKMDSIVDYVKKKEERSKRLIKGSQIKVHKTVELFNNKTGVSLPKMSSNFVTKKLLERKNGLFTRTIQKENVKSGFSFLKHQYETEDIRDKNRKFIQGVRTNKRFELQMKLRNT